MNRSDGVSLENLRVAKKQAGRTADLTGQKEEITFYVNGQPIQACPGETIHAALIAAGYRQFRKSKTKQPRGIFCGMGVCYECLVTIDNGPRKQACVTIVEEGMEVQIDAG
jgi:predicted molibdopterin-dependent oxidoreductase YjgC